MYKKRNRLLIILNLTFYQLALLNPGKLPLLDSILNTKREYFVNLTVLQILPEMTHLFLCWIIELSRSIFDLLYNAK